MNSILRPRTSRYRGGVAFEEKRTNAWAAFIGFLLGRGLSTEAIAERLDDGTDSGTIRRMAQKWGLPAWGRKSDGFIVVPVTMKQRAHIHARAQQHGLGDEEFCRRILTCATMPADLYDAIVPDDQFEDMTR
jgi:hypothetical protein